MFSAFKIAVSAAMLTSFTTVFENGYSNFSALSSDVKVDKKIHQSTNLEALQEQLCKQDLTLCNSVKKVRIIGKEDGHIISNDPNSEEAKLGEAIGSAGACKKAIGTLSLVEFRNKNYLIGNAHGFFKNGLYICKNDEKSGVFEPDYHYQNVDGINHRKRYKFKLPPLNRDYLIRTPSRNKSGYFHNINARDFSILEINDKSLLLNQFGKKRTILKISEKLIKSNISDENIIFISERENFHSYKQTSIQENCNIRYIPGTVIQKHNCDSGPGSSGAPLIIKKNSDYYVIGIHYGGITVSDEEFKTTSKGNYFIPLEHIIENFKKVVE